MKEMMETKEIIEYIRFHNGERREVSFSPYKVRDNTKSDKDIDEFFINEIVRGRFPVIKIAETIFTRECEIFLVEISPTPMLWDYLSSLDNEPKPKPCCKQT